jgi:hypothetical protein
VQPSKSASTWEAYESAFQARYSTAPIRNQTVNAQLCKLVDMVGAEQAPQLAAFYVQSEEPFYVQKVHPVNLLLGDAQKLRTQMTTGLRLPQSVTQRAPGRPSHHHGLDHFNEESGAL